jgi:hypothetical protein
VPYAAHWGKYEGETVRFGYCNELRSDSTYIWLDCFAKQLEEIRLELGLTRSRALNPDDGIFHITIANLKSI